MGTRDTRNKRGLGCTSCESLTWLELTKCAQKYVIVPRPLHVSLADVCIDEVVSVPEGLMALCHDASKHPFQVVFESATEIQAGQVRIRQAVFSPDFDELLTEVECPASGFQDAIVRGV